MSQRQHDTHLSRPAAVVWRWSPILVHLFLVCGASVTWGADEVVIADKTLVAWVAPANLTRTRSTADRKTDKAAGNAPVGLFHGRPAWRRMCRLARTHTFPPWPSLTELPRLDRYR